MAMGLKLFAERSDEGKRVSAARRRPALSRGRFGLANIGTFMTMMVVVLAGLGFASAAMAPRPAEAQAARGQQRGDWYINVGGVIVAEPGRESAFPIVVGPASALPIGSTVRIIGLSPYCELIGGTQLAQGAWSVPADELGRLRIRVPQVEPVRMEVRLALVDGSGVELARARSTFMIAKADELAPADASGNGAAAATDGSGRSDARETPVLTPRVAQPPTFSPSPRGGRGDATAIEPDAALSASTGAAAVEPAQQVVRALSGEDLQAALAQMERGNGLVARGDYATARLFFRKAAELGHAAGAIALAKTFDPAELRRLGVVGFTGDEAEAKKWYARAKELGAGSF